MRIIWTGVTALALLSMSAIAALQVSDFVHPAGPLEGRNGLVMAYAVRHRSGVVMFDTGIGLGNREVDRTYRARSRPLETLLAEAGIGLEEVTAVVNSHLHFDHAGQNRLFPDRPIYVQAAEHRASRAPRYTVPDWIDAPGLRYELIDGEAEIAPGIRIIATPGHTPGHQSVVVTDGDRRAVIAGQAVYTYWLK
jgi:N-acyl homoserine lactone hydrolase